MEQLKLRELLFEIILGEPLCESKRLNFVQEITLRKFLGDYFGSSFWLLAIELPFQVSCSILMQHLPGIDMCWWWIFSLQFLMIKTVAISKKKKTLIQFALYTAFFSNEGMYERFFVIFQSSFPHAMILNVVLLVLFGGK